MRYGATQKSDTRLCNSVSFTNISNLCRKLALGGCGDEQLKSISHMFNSEKCALGVLHMCCAGFGLFLFDFSDELKSIYICCRYYAFTWPFLNRCFFFTFDSYQKYNTYQRCMNTYLVFSIYITEIRDSGEIIIARLHRLDEENFFKASLVIFLIAHRPIEESTLYQARDKLIKWSHSRLLLNAPKQWCYCCCFAISSLLFQHVWLRHFIVLNVLLCAENQNCLWNHASKNQLFNMHFANSTPSRNSTPYKMLK